MSDSFISVLRLLQNVLSLLSIAWLLLGMRQHPGTLEEHYRYRCRILLPAISLNYSSSVLGILAARYSGKSDTFYLIMLCLNTCLLEDLIIRTLRLRNK